MNAAWNIFLTHNHTSPYEAKIDQEHTLADSVQDNIPDFQVRFSQKLLSFAESHACTVTPPGLQSQ